MDRERTNTNTTLLTEQQRRCSLCFGRGGFGSFWPIDVGRSMRLISLAHLFFAVLFFGSMLEHMFMFPYLVNTVPIRITAVILAVLSLLLAALSFGSLVKGNLGGKRDRMFTTYIMINIFAAMLVFFLFLMELVEGFFMVAARYYATFTTQAGYDTRRMSDVQADYAQHPIWATCLCYTLLLTVFLLHICFGRVACNAKHQGQSASGAGTAGAPSGQQQFQHSLLRETTK